MIINKKNFSILTRSDKPNENWTSSDCYIVADGSELANKILNNYPNIEYIIENDKIVDIDIVIKEEEKSVHEKILELKNTLDSTDYKIIKCLEYQLAGKELPYNIEDLHAERQAIRDEINTLQGSLE